MSTSFDSLPVQIVRTMQVSEQELDSNVASAKAYITDIQNSLDNFIQSYKKYTELSLEQKDIIASSRAASVPTEGLPGVMSGSLGSYDIESLRKANARLMEIKKEIEPLEKESTQMWKFVEADFARIRSSLSNAGQCQLSINSLLDSLDTMK